MIRNALFVCLFLASLLGAGQAAALCSQPNLPFCAAGGDFQGGFGSPEACRRDVERYRARLDAYRSCLADALQEVEAEMVRIDRMLATETETPQG